MGVQTIEVYTCDVGNLQSEDPAGWVRFTLTMTSPDAAAGPPTSAPGADPLPDGTYQQRTSVACPDHAPRVLEIFNDAFQQILDIPVVTPLA